MNSNKLTVKSIMDLVSWNTLTASLFPFLVGAMYSVYHYHTINYLYMIIYFIVALCMDLMVNVFDNLDDYEVAERYRATGILKINPVYNHKLSKKQVMIVLWGLMFISGILGLYLVFETGWELLIIGLIGFITSIIYSKLLQNIPVGELVSGVVMGFLIPLGAIYINNFFKFNWSIKEMLSILLVTLPNILWIANMMLANNICDIDYDKQCGRITYPIKVGATSAIKTFNLLNIIALIAIPLAVLLGLIPWTTLFTLILIPYIYKKCKSFNRRQIKSDTFLSSVKILAVASLFQSITFLVGIIF